MAAIHQQQQQAQPQPKPHHRGRGRPPKSGIVKVRSGSDGQAVQATTCPVPQPGSVLPPRTYATPGSIDGTITEVLRRLSTTSTRSGSSTAVGNEKETRRGMEDYAEGERRRKRRFLDEEGERRWGGTEGSPGPTSMGEFLIYCFLNQDSIGRCFFVKQAAHSIEMRL